MNDDEISLTVTLKEISSLGLAISFAYENLEVLKSRIQMSVGAENFEQANKAFLCLKDDLMSVNNKLLAKAFNLE